MSDRLTHRASLLLALVGAALMLVTMLGHMQPRPGLPNRESSGRPPFQAPWPYEGPVA